MRATVAVQSRSVAPEMANAARLQAGNPNCREDLFACGWVLSDTAQKQTGGPTSAQKSLVILQQNLWCVGKRRLAERNECVVSGFQAGICTEHNPTIDLNACRGVGCEE